MDVARLGVWGGECGDSDREGWVSAPLSVPVHARWRAGVCVHLDGGAVGIGAGWPYRNVAQKTQTISPPPSLELLLVYGSWVRQTKVTQPAGGVKTWVAPEKRGCGRRHGGENPGGGVRRGKEMGGMGVRCGGEAGGVRGRGVKSVQVGVEISCHVVGGDADRDGVLCG
ncbi:hypothetical protein F7725_014799 [Dissostichus mawsoni]|uniref:Uncharacterized protein n=1 Tax=Dissostichus mawsoni TaxID=36200 RepID=A0A7J5YZ79_DISMA|nr:hypothetical protein F7725_014799 [Dissostichus mawsoni]